MKKENNSDLSECFFMANFGRNCEKEGCLARKLKRDYLANDRGRLSQEERDEMREKIEQAAMEAGCPYFPNQDQNRA